MNLELFEEFLTDEHAWDFYITGVAGTGKTTSLKEYVQFCVHRNLKHKVVAYTHKACNVLCEKLPEETAVGTLHAFLQKRPTINSEAKTIKHIEGNAVFGEAEDQNILFIDEFSMIGESDLMDLRALQDPDYDGDPGMKVVWIGDPLQLPPVKDAEAVIPKGKYWVELKTIYRSAKDNPLQETIKSIVGMLDGTRVVASLKRHECFQQQTDLVERYKNEEQKDKIFLAFTNKRVQEVNFEVADRDTPQFGDTLFCGTVNKYFTFLADIPVDQITRIDRFWSDPLEFGSKYKTLEFLVAQNMCQFFLVEDEEGEEKTYATCFGSYNVKLMKEELGREAVTANSAIESEFGGKANVWAKQNWQHPLARVRALAWRKYMVMKDIASMDFSHAMTVHKSQGSTYSRVYLDAEDLAICMNTNFNLYLRLYYVAISRASQLVVTN